MDDEDLTALSALRYADALEYVEDFMRAWHDTMRDPVGRASLTVAYQQVQADGESRGGMRCCGTVSEWHRPWCRTGPRRYRMQEAALNTGNLEELVGLINLRVGAWQEFGYENPPTPDCATIPPLGERSAKAIEAGHEAIKDIDELIAQLHRVREKLVGELRTDEDIRMARLLCPLCGHGAHPETPTECQWCPEGYCEAKR